jgi:hypothetical protein
LDKKNILICPLEWGLGHSSRMIPLAITLRDMNHNVIVASGEEHLMFFRKEVPGIKYLRFPGFKPRYSRFIPQYLFILMKTPLLLYHTISEHYKLKKIINEYNINLIISDNRFGLWNKNIESVYVTHMLRIPLPKSIRFMEFVGIILHRMIIRQYTYCLVPDLPGNLNISGRLSHNIKIPDNVRYIGILSRFLLSDKTSNKKNEVTPYSTVILSGPEPQRTILKNLLTKIFKDHNHPTYMMLGRPEEEKDEEVSGNIISFNNMPTNEMKGILIGSTFIVSRSGYTTIMDLISLNCCALLIPTPGQTEQEYLAEYMSEKGWFFTIKQTDISHGITFPTTKYSWTDEIVRNSNILLKESLKEILENPHY